MSQRDEHPLAIKVYPEPSEEDRRAFREELERLGSDRVIVLPLAAEASRVDLVLPHLARQRMTEDYLRHLERFGTGPIVRLYRDQARYWIRRGLYHRRKRNRAARAAERRSP